MAPSQDVGDALISENAVESSASKQEQSGKHPQTRLSLPRGKRPSTGAKEDCNETGQDKERGQWFLEDHQYKAAEQTGWRVTNDSINLLRSEPEGHVERRVLRLTP
jgi:hypothetical protein